MNDSEMVELEAERQVRRNGREALTQIYRAAETATLNGDRLSAQAWFDIGDAAERLLESNQRL